MKKIIITISREFGCGAREIARKLASDLGITFYDKDLVDMAAQKAGVHVDVFKNSDEVIMSRSASKLFREFGYGSSTAFYSEQAIAAQADVIRENLEVYKEDNRLTGTFIWQFADCKVTEEEWFSTRARCHNNKGVVDEYRRPKEAYDVVKEYFNQMPEGYDEL